MATTLSEIEKTVFERFKILEVSAENCPHGLLYILAPDVKIGEEKAKTIITGYRGDFELREVEVNDEIRKMRYYNDAIEWASNHKLIGYVPDDAFWFNSFHDEEAERKEKEEARAKQEFYKMLAWPL